MGRPATGTDDPRRFRYPETHWKAVQDKAAADQRTASEVIRIFLDAYRSGTLGVLPDGRLWLSGGDRG
ncbi:hypothetical protein AGRA3207_000199 [Actinomadura graeca]|uniref:Ribbon-helix-helix DNA binding domain protein n=1 Tax=Actinomadura graeca TaxID=2750812 RepID=A0ABX8QM33_9ACTN|nr:hypothetical protein [Actinomadura graeca]QXJ19637.1 hypothetical protein AGRA3207_000199 [Actinomadura graeca]